AAVDGLVEIALGRGGLADRAKDERILAVVADGSREADRMRRVVGNARRCVLNADLGFREMIRHVASARGDVGRLGHAVPENLFTRQARGDASRQVAVVREEIVSARTKGHPESELNRVVSGARSVITPSESLLEIVGSLVIQNA